MKKSFTQNIILLTLFIAGVQSMYAHDAWLSAKWNAMKTHILISPVVAEIFPNGESIKEMKRFIEPSVYFPDGCIVSLSGDRLDSTLLGSILPASSFIVSAGVKQREITYKKDIAQAYLTEEAGLSKEQLMTILTPGINNFTESYSRYLKALVSLHNTAPRDSGVGLPLELVLLSWKDTSRHRATIQFRVLEKGKPVVDAPVRVLSNGNTTIVKTDSSGVAMAIVEKDQPVLLAYIQVTKLGEGRLQSLWTNLAIYRLGK